MVTALEPDLEPIAITGMACRLPGAPDVGALMALIEEGRDAFQVLPAERFDADLYAADLPAWLCGSPLLGAVVEDLPVDWRTIALPPLLVQRMHRMERLALQTMIAALADAGVDPAAGMERALLIMAASTLGTDAAVSPSWRVRRHELAAQVSEVLQEKVPDMRAQLDAVIERRLERSAPALDVDSMGSTASLIAGRLAHLYDFHGGHLAVDGGMASSLAAVERGCVALRFGESDLVVVCAVSPLLTPPAILAFAHAGYLGPRRPRPFAGGQGGTLLGEGCVAVVLRRYGDTGARERRIHALIGGLGSATLGKEPDPEGTERVTRDAARMALEQARVAPARVRFVESRACGHGPSDAAEAAGLAGALAPEEAALSSTVPSIGFLPAAAGLVALLKGALALSRGRLPGRPIGVLRAGGVAEMAGPIDLPPGSWAAVSDVGLGPLGYVALLTTEAGLEAQRPSIEPPGRPPAAPVQALRPAPEPIAIVGCGLVVPQASDVATFWQNILGRVDAIGDLPSGRWDVDRLSGAGREVGQFLKTRLAGAVRLPPQDLGRFGIPPAMAATVDPALLLTLLCGEQALSDAGYVPGRWDNRRVQVVLGQLPLRAQELEVERRVLFAEQLRLIEEALHELGISRETARAVASTARERLCQRLAPLSGTTLAAFSGLPYAARLAAQYDLRGGVLCVDAACASSLVAVELARQSLLSRQADVVLAGGLAYNLLPEYYLILNLLGFLSPRGAPSFTAESDGFVPGEGAGMVVLKRLRDALSARDRIYAVVRGSGLASDGRGRSIFAPSTAGQQRAIRRALAMAQVAPAQVDLVEAHGTGTQLADHTEAATYAAVYGDRDPGAPLSISTLKGQIGHLSAAAGIVGVIKTALALREGILPPGASDTPPAVELPFSRLPLELATEARPWVTRPGQRRMAGVSAFGLGGVNCHLILEEPPPPPGERRHGPPHRRPAPLPPRGTIADRFAVELVPLSLPARPPRFSLRGRLTLLIPDRGGVVQAFVRALQARGAEPILLPVAGSEEALAALGSQPISAVIDLSPLDRHSDLLAQAPAEIAAELDRRSRRAFLVVRALYERLAEGGCYAAITALAGLGLLQGEALQADPLGALHLGLVKGLKQELPGLCAKAIDFTPGTDPAELAALALQEIEDGNDRTEVAYLGRRLVPNLQREGFAGDAPLMFPVRDGEVFLFSGGGRGVAFTCACALARLGAIVVVCGRTAPPDPASPYLAMDDGEFATWRAEEMLRRRRADPRLTPVAFQSEMEPLVRQRELHQNLQHAQRFSLPIHYEVCDINDLSQVLALAAKVRDRFGHIDGVVHGAMVEWSHSLPKKTPTMIEKTLQTKVLGLLHLLGATRDDPVRRFVCFGSGAGRFGNRGQVDYSAANALIAVLLPAWARRHGRPPSYVTIDWTAWQGTGAAAATKEMAALIRQSGLTSIEKVEGTYWFLTELAMGTRPEVVVFEERMLHDWPFLGPRAEGSGDRAVPFDDRGVPLLPGAWPMVDYLVERGPGRVQFERRLDLARDPFLDQHRLYETPIVPATFGCEILAEAAALAAPGLVLLRGEEIHIGVPVKLHRGEPLLIRASARITEERDGLVVVVAETRSHLFLRGRVVQADRLHHRGRFVFGTSRPPVLTIDIPEGKTVLHARSFFHMTKDPIRLGPLYCRAEWLQILSEEVSGSVRSPRQRDVLRHTSYPLFQVDPLLMDAALQIAANWDGHHHGLVSLPLALSALELGRPRRRDEGARVRATVRAVRDPDVFYDIVVAGEGGDLLMRLSNVHLRRIGRLSP